VEVLAAEQTPDSSDWFQGTADAVRQAARHFKGFDADYFLILAGDHLYRMDFCQLIDSHIEHHADITIAAQPVSAGDATQMGIFTFDDLGKISGFEEKPAAERLTAIGGSGFTGARTSGTTADKPFVASMGIYVFNREVLLEILERHGFTCYTPYGAYYIMTDIADFGFPDDVEFARYLVKEIGVAAVPGSSFYRDAAMGRTKLRFCYCKRDETLAEADRRLAKLASVAPHHAHV